MTNSEIKIACFNKADIRIFRVFNKAVLGSESTAKSLGLAYLTPHYANRINHLADKGKITLNKRPMCVYFNFLEDEKFKEENCEHMASVLTEIIFSEVDNQHPFVCTFASLEVIPQIISYVPSLATIRCWDIAGETPETKPYHLYLDECGNVRCILFPENALKN
ncbi:MAG TPA: hypothetical protein VG621_00820 [Candidatus Paceibacterota bacterium]|nr:hypothetical protein [Candidatus Paceibacterota bacterium]